MTTDFGWNLGYVDDLHARYLADPSSVNQAWREFFADYHPDRVPGSAVPSGPASTPRERDGRRFEYM